MKAIVELIGTFLLVFTIALAAVFGRAGDAAPFAIVAALVAAIYAGGHISGAHYNPAVSVSLLARKKLGAGELGAYVGAQLLGAALAVGLAMSVFRGESAVAPLAVELVPALVAEFVFTFALVFVVHNVATAKANAGNSFYGAAIGLTVLAGAFTVGSISGGVFNPAVAVALGILGKLGWGTVVPYVAVELLAGVVAGVTFGVVSPSDAAEG